MNKSHPLNYGKHAQLNNILSISVALIKAESGGLPQGLGNKYIFSLFVKRDVRCVINAHK